MHCGKFGSGLSFKRASFFHNFFFSTLQLKLVYSMCDSHQLRLIMLCIIEHSVPSQKKNIDISAMLKFLVFGFDKHSLFITRFPSR